jgi:hypothetical protein
MGKRALLILVLIVIAPSAAHAQNATGGIDGSAAQHWGIIIWGVSYHIDKTVDYTSLNWGLGVRYHHRPGWWWLGHDEDNRVFVEADALRNSNKGLAVPVSAGVEYAIGTVPGGCRVFAVGALTAAYYRKPARHKTEVKVGPVPGLAVGCGRIKTNMTVVLRGSKPVVAAITGSLTIAL